MDVNAVSSSSPSQMYHVPGSFEDSLTLFNQLNAVRCVTISGTAVLVYDTLLTFPDEVTHVWATLLQARAGSRRLLLAKMMYLVGRYMMIATAITALIMILPLYALSEKWCLRALIFVSTGDASIEIMATGLVFYRLQSLWQLDRWKTRALIAMFIGCKAIVWTSTILTIIDMKDAVRYINLFGINTCFSLRTSHDILGAYITGAVSDTIAFSLLLLNALSRPRLESQRLLSILYHDSAIFFLTLLSMRTLNSILTALAPPSLFVLGIIFSGTIVTTVSSRCFLSLFRVRDTEDGNLGVQNSFPTARLKELF